MTDPETQGFAQSLLEKIAEMQDEADRAAAETLLRETEAAAAEEDTDPVELASLALDAESAARLDELCRAKRAVAAQIGPLKGIDDKLKEELKPLAARLRLPKRVLGGVPGDGWDLRRQERETLDQAVLKIEMVKAGLKIGQIRAIVAAATKKGEAGYAVYARGKKK